MTIGILILGVLLIFGCNSPDNDTDRNGSKLPSERIVTNNTIVSKTLPEIRIKVAEEFVYLGDFEFEIIANSNEYPEDLQGKPVAAGERLVFAKANGNSDIEKLFIVQFEGFLPSNDFVYNYDFSTADFIGSKKYRHNTWYYDPKVSIKENPLGELARTDAFLREKGFLADGDFMMSRFVGLASDDRKNEIIIFYHEMLENSTGYSLDQWENEVSEEEAVAIDNAFAARSRVSFEILD